MWLAVVLICGLTNTTTPCTYDNDRMVYSQEMCEGIMLDKLENRLSYYKRIDYLHYHKAYIDSKTCMYFEPGLTPPTKEE